MYHLKKKRKKKKNLGLVGTITKNNFFL